MKKTLISFLLTLFVINSSGQANLREYVAIVRPTYTASTIKFLNDFSRTMERYGYKESAKLLKDYAKEGFGSGFLFIDTNSGRKFIVTNRHVVAQANVATIEFSIPGEEALTYKYCDVVYVDEELDLALITLPSDFPKNEGMQIKVETPADASDIYSAGFPGLGSEPSWQISKGIISNNSVYNKDLSGTAKVGAIQHTAPIDGGSSGGPLLIQTTSNPTGYEVIGINTWKAAGRESANFAISSKSVKAFLDAYLSKKAVGDDREALKKQASKFTQAINKSYQDILPFVSSDYIANISVTGFQDLYASISDSVRTKVMQSFTDGRPIDGVRIAIAEAIYNKYNKQTLSLSSVGEVAQVLNQPSSEVIFLQNEKPMPMVWIFEQGHWRIKHLTTLKTNDLDSKGISTRYGYPNAFRLGVEIPMGSDIEDMRYTATFNRTYRTFLIYGFKFGMGKLKDLVRSTDIIDPATQTFGTEIYSKGFFFTDVELGGQLPIKVSSLYLVPNAKGFLGMNFGEETGGSSYGFTLGLQAAKKLGGRTYLIGGLDFNRRFILSQDYDYPDSDYKFPPFNTIGIHIGITW